MKFNWLINWFGWFNKNPIHRQTSCDVCYSELIEHSLKTQILMDGSEDTVYEERCVQCGNLLYGWVKKTKQSTIELIQNKEEEQNGTNKLISRR